MRLREKKSPRISACLAVAIGSRALTEKLFRFLSLANDNE